MKKLDSTVTLTIQQLKNIFLAGSRFEKNFSDFEMGEVEEITELDFGDFLKEELNIDLE